MNMMTSIEAASAKANVGRAGNEGELFPARRAGPPDRVGPDLRKAAPIQEVIRDMGPARNGFWHYFMDACRNSGIDLTVGFEKDGIEHLLFGCPCDGQEDLRRMRLEALMGVLSRSPARRQQIVDVLNMIGRFVDNRPFASVAEAAEQFRAAGGRIMVRPDGVIEEALPITGEMLNREQYDGYPLRRLHFRFDCTLRQTGARAEMAELVRAHGKLHEGSGWIVWEKAA